MKDPKDVVTFMNEGHYIPERDISPADREDHVLGDHDGEGYFESDYPQEQE